MRASDLHGIGRLALLGLDLAIDRIEAAHLNAIGTADTTVGSRSVAGCAYRQARAIVVMLGRLVDAMLGQGGAEPHDAMSSDQRDAVLAALNGLVGDTLARIDNPLAIRMALRMHGRALQIDPAALAATFPVPGARLLVMVHGLCRNDLQWRRRKHDHGAALAHEFGYTPLYLLYNSGRHVSTNGRELAHLLEQCVLHWPVPVEEMVILAHSMGGLVARSACRSARVGRLAWLTRLTHVVFLGTPHHGAPLERHGHWLGTLLGRNPWTAPLARLGEWRSAGITDLRFGNLVDADWRGRDRFAHHGDTRHLVPLPKGVRCYAIAGSVGKRAGDMRERLLGDGLIPVDSALGRHAERARTLRIPPSRQWIAFGVHHLDLLSSTEVYGRIRAWLSEPRR